MLVGHSYGGMVITELADHPAVSSHQAMFSIPDKLAAVLATVK